MKQLEKEEALKSREQLLSQSVNNKQLEVEGLVSEIEENKSLLAESESGLKRGKEDLAASKEEVAKRKELSAVSIARLEVSETEALKSLEEVEGSLSEASSSLETKGEELELASSALNQFRKKSSKERESLQGLVRAEAESLASSEQALVEKDREVSTAGAQRKGLLANIAELAGDYRNSQKELRGVEADVVNLQSLIGGLKSSESQLKRRVSKKEEDLDVLVGEVEKKELELVKLEDGVAKLNKNKFEHAERERGFASREERLREHYSAAGVKWPE